MQREFIRTNTGYKPPNQKQQARRRVDREVPTHQEEPERCRPEAVVVVHRVEGVEGRCQEGVVGSPICKGVSDSNSSKYRPRPSGGNLTATRGWRGGDRDMSGAYIHRKYCKQRTELVLDEVPFVAVAASPSPLRVHRVQLRANPQSVISRAAPVAHQVR